MGGGRALTIQRNDLLNRRPRLDDEVDDRCQEAERRNALTIYSDLMRSRLTCFAQVVDDPFQSFAFPCTRLVKVFKTTN